MSPETRRAIETIGEVVLSIVLILCLTYACTH